MVWWWLNTEPKPDTCNWCYSCLLTVVMYLCQFSWFRIRNHNGVPDARIWLCQPVHTRHLSCHGTVIKHHLHLWKLQVPMPVIESDFARDLHQTVYSGDSEWVRKRFARNRLFRWFRMIRFFPVLWVLNGCVPMSRVFPVTKTWHFLQCVRKSRFLRWCNKTCSSRTAIKQP